MEQSGEHILRILSLLKNCYLKNYLITFENYLKTVNLSSTVQQNLVLVLHTVFKLAGCKKLHDYSLETICALLDKEMFYVLLQRNDLQIEEVIVWNCSIKSNKLLSSDKVKWNNKNYEALLEKTLDRFILLIRFEDIRFVLIRS
jgi:hypothetical protein